MAARSLRLDGLRGLAVCGIAFVNVWGFAYGMELHRFADNGVPSLADQLTVALVSLLAEQKFYPIFAFLFGAGFALQTGARRAPGPALDAIGVRYRRRLHWLLVVGLLHGSLLWFGDILAAYALTGYWLAGRAGRPLRELKASLRPLVLVNLVMLLVYGTVMWVGTVMLSPAELAQAQAEAVRAHQVWTAGSWLDIAAERLLIFAANLVGLVFVLPRFALLFVLGVLAVRLGWLTRPARHQQQWRTVRLLGLAIGIPASAWWAAVSLAVFNDPLGHTTAFGIGQLIIDVAGPILAAGVVACIMLASERLLAGLAPLGKMALTNYLGQSVCFMLLLQGFGLGLGASLSHLQLALLTAAVLGGQWLFSTCWLKYNKLGPVERLWRQHADRVEIA